ncbi:MAG: NYN domain-containing protein [Candidatus Pacebacteria bacterium]|nr:NYN domain-containing protein [Candidatus Paceibacterota bacterium]
MEIPQDIKNKIMVREDYLEWLEKEPVVFVYLDLTNMFHWQDVLGWKFRIEDLIEQLKTYKNIQEIKVYYGLNTRDLKNSKAFHKRILKTGAILKTKPMKYIPKTIKEGMFFQRKTMTLFDDGVKSKIEELVDELHKPGILIEEPKCNFDVEMTMDILDDAKKFSAVILFSGDSDMQGPLQRLKIENKKIGICGVRNQVAEELHKIKDKYFDFGRLYTGKRNYEPKSENPAKAGPRD